MADEPNKKIIDEEDLTGEDPEAIALLRQIQSERKAFESTVPQKTAALDAAIQAEDKEVIALEKDTIRDIDQTIKELDASLKIPNLPVEE